MTMTDNDAVSDDDIDDDAASAESHGSNGDKARRQIRKLDEAMEKIKAARRRMHDAWDYDVRNPDSRLESKGGTFYLGEDDEARAGMTSAILLASRCMACI
jgi:hypothetical protein